MKRKYLSLFSLAGLIICLDQITKHIVETSPAFAERREIIPSFLNLVRSHKSGFVFGMWEHVPKSLEDVFVVGIPVFALILIVLIFIKLKDDQYVMSLALATILAGAVGNLIDRVRFGYVIDFLDIHLGSLVQLPSFNLADCSIILGVVLMFVHTLKAPQNKQVTT